MTPEDLLADQGASKEKNSRSIHDDASFPPQTTPSDCDEPPWKNVTPFHSPASQSPRPSLHLSSRAAGPDFRLTSRAQKAPAPAKHAHEARAEGGACLSRRTSPRAEKSTLKLILGGTNPAVNTISSRRQDSQPKRPAQTSATPAEPTRSAKRQKKTVEREASPANDYSQTRFVLGPTPPPAGPTRTTPPTKDRQSSSVVDLTESQISGDGETTNNRSTTAPSISSLVSEYRTVEKTIATSANSGNKRPRRRKLASQQRKSPINLDNDEDDLAKEPPDWQGNGTRTVRKQTANRFARAPKSSPEGISDSELDELATLHSSTRKRHHSLTSEHANEEKMSPSTSSRRQERADIARVDFSNKKQKLDELDLKLKRAVCGEKTADFAGLDLAQQPSLRRESNPNCLFLVDANKRRLEGYEWIDIKLGFCFDIQYAAVGAPIAKIRRSSVPLLVLEFAEVGGSCAFGVWAEERLNKISTLSVKVAGSDAGHLQKILNNSWEKASTFKRIPRDQVDEARLREHFEDTEPREDEQPSERNAVRPNSAQQHTPYQSSHSLRSGMNPEGAVSTPSSLSRAKANTGRDEERTVQSEPRQAGGLLSRTTREVTTRRTLVAKPTVLSPRSPSPPRWTEQNPDWSRIWDEKPLIFPATGKNRASVYKDDIGRLEEGQYLNDNLIGFYLRYLQMQLEKENKPLADRIYFMNTYFYPKLTERPGRGINYDGVKSWTAKVDLFSYDYIVVPVNESMHWYLVIICNPSKLIKAKEIKVEAAEPESEQEPREEGAVSSVGEQVGQMSLDDMSSAVPLRKDEAGDPKTPTAKSQTFRKSTGSQSRSKDPYGARAITLDSMGAGHSSTCGNLKEYLVRELRDKKGVEIEPPAQFGMTAKNIPEQLDATSCGAFLLGYLREFIKNPDEVVNRLVRKEKLDWSISSQAMRGEVRSIIIEQRKEQNERTLAIKKARRKSASRTPVPSMSPEKEANSEPIGPTTPRPAVDAPKNPSSTVKGSPAAPRSSLVKPNIRVEPQAAVDSGFEKLSTNALGSPIKNKAFMSPLRSSPSPKQPETPTLEQLKPPVVTPRPQASKPDESASTSEPLEIGPSQNDNKHGGSAAKQAKLMGPIPSSSPPTKEGDKHDLETTPSETRRRTIDLSSPVVARRSKKPSSGGPDGSISPGQQLLAELEASPSKPKQTRASASKDADADDKRGEKGMIAKEAKTKTPLRNAKGSAEVSPYFSPNNVPRVKFSPAAGYGTPKS
ncbi:ulp1 protease family protein [Colletotrichum musicola]|uniref:Ulp1 protease family protein n=1 Tax=Colletotrichum musicola TaxID=2175873 RepID=A0A8H6NU20_9PEZI|nr:ulp1 protease family protein [Colletotrichum musicola]